jgi:hypothetical protein
MSDSLCLPQTLRQWPEKQAKSNRVKVLGVGHNGLKGVYVCSGGGEDTLAVRAPGGIGRREGLRIQRIALFSGFMRLLANCV